MFEERYSRRVNRGQTVNTIRLAFVSALAIAAAPAARAQVVVEETPGAGAVYGKSEYPVQSLPRQPLTLSQGLVELGAPFRVDVSSPRQAGTPRWNVPLYLDLGLADSLQVGVWHKTGICPGNASDGCAKGYDDVGGRVRVGVLRLEGAAQLAVEARFLVFNFDDTTWQGSVAALYKHTLGRFAFLLDVDWTSLLNKRDVLAFADAFGGNAQVQLELVPGLAAYGLVGVAVPVKKGPTVTAARANTRAPVGVGAELAPFHQLAVGAELLFPNLIGENGTGDLRQVTAYARLFL